MKEWNAKNMKACQVICLFTFAGVISLSRSLHGKANTVIAMVISAEDGGGQTAPINARVNVSIVGGSVVSPTFDQAQYFFTVSEDVLRGTAVGAVRAAIKTGGNGCALNESFIMQRKPVKITN